MFRCVNILRKNVTALFVVLMNLWSFRITQKETQIFLNKRIHGASFKQNFINLLTPNVNYSGRTAPLTSKVAFYIFIQQMWVLNILTMVYILRFFSSKCSLFHNSNVFCSCIIHILYTGCAKIKKNNSGAKRLMNGIVK